MGEINWTALPTVAAMYGVTDIETFIHQLAAIRDSLRKK